MRHPARLWRPSADGGWPARRLLSGFYLPAPPALRGCLRRRGGARGLISPLLSTRVARLECLASPPLPRALLSSRSLRPSLHFSLPSVLVPSLSHPLSLALSGPLSSLESFPLILSYPILSPVRFTFRSSLVFFRSLFVCSPPFVPSPFCPLLSSPIPCSFHFRFSLSLVSF